MNELPLINPQQEKKRIVTFLKNTFQKQKIEKAVIGLSGGIDSTVCYFLLKEAIPEKNIFGVHLPYFQYATSGVEKTVISIQNMANTICRELKINMQKDKIRAGNIMARLRMIVLFDLAKKNNALVIGTENKTECLLGYYTRFGDAASDIEPISHLYKTQVYQLAKYLKIPQDIIDKKPSANLWPGQTDEAEFGFTYQEADNVLFLYFEQKKSKSEITKLGFRNANKIIDFALKNQFKLHTPYHV